MGCPYCGRFFHDECITDGGCRACHSDDYEFSTAVALVAPSPVAESEHHIDVPTVESPKRSVGVKSPEQVKDPLSTGRKRAAMMYPIFPGKACEWRGKKNCGGGLHPIVGCIEGVQEHVHHGPVKNTLRNEPTNVHRICATCHNRWHGANNPVYDEELYDTLPHQPQPATDLELRYNDISRTLK